MLSHTLSEMVKCRGRECILPRYHNENASQQNNLGGGGGGGVLGLGETNHRRKNGEFEEGRMVEDRQRGGDKSLTCRENTVVVVRAGIEINIVGNGCCFTDFEDAIGGSMAGKRKLKYTANK